MLITDNYSVSFFMSFSSSMVHVELECAQYRYPVIVVRYVLLLLCSQ